MAQFPPTRSVISSLKGLTASRLPISNLMTDPHKQVLNPVVYSWGSNLPVVHAFVDVTNVCIPLQFIERALNKFTASGGWIVGYCFNYPSQYTMSWMCALIGVSCRNKLVDTIRDHWCTYAWSASNWYEASSWKVRLPYHLCYQLGVHAVSTYVLAIKKKVFPNVLREG